MKVLITVKAYPTLSAKYDELVCTAGFDENGNWIRIYPIPFRKLDEYSKFKKYQWIDLDLVRNTSDPRPESYKPRNYENIKSEDWIDTEKGLWTKRKEIVLKKVYFDIQQLIDEAKDTSICTSLAVFKPKEITGFKIEEVTRNWDLTKIKKIKARTEQGNLFSDSEQLFKVVRKLPYKFSYTFIDINNKECTLMIEDWEIGMLYWNTLRTHNKNELKACEDVKKKYFDDFAGSKDLYLFLGTTREYHFVGPNPFVIVGTFHPKK